MAAFAFDQGALATLGLRRIDGSRDPLALATVGLMCLPAPPAPPPAPPKAVVQAFGGTGGASFYVVPPCREDDPGCMEEPVEDQDLVIEDVPLDLAIDTAGDLTDPFGRLVAELALLFDRKPRE